VLAIVCWAILVLGLIYNQTHVLEAKILSEIIDHDVSRVTGGAADTTTLSFSAISKAQVTNQQMVAWQN
jgi:hypothetical protein